MEGTDSHFNGNWTGRDIRHTSADGKYDCSYCKQRLLLYTSYHKINRKCRAYNRYLGSQLNTRSASIRLILKRSVHGMEAAVNGEAGKTAGIAALKDIIVCGKTGTAQNPHGKNHSVFIAFAPKDNPKIAIW